MKHRIAPLMTERAAWLSKPAFAPARRLMERLLRFPETLTWAEICRDLPADRVMSVMAALIACNTRVTGLEHIPRIGPALIVANHPTGIADGIILHHLLAPIRRDLFFFANADILRVLPQMAPMIAPVEWRPDKRCHSKARATMVFTRAAITAGRLGVIFPSGRLAKRRGLHLHERPWMASAAQLARKHDLPVIPVNIRARNSTLFYLLDRIHPSLRDITLFHEVLNKADQPFRLTVGRAIPAAHLPQGAEAATQFLRDATLGMGGTARPTLGLLETRRPPIWLEPVAPLP
ncbi:glycerol acyltransferase [Pseudorhodobacter sp. E13]|uniref:lysophospholipid acyltransferase family protein n=1 Tax=Pseudorhodobacter sp. E13 TaxID=2487931 RepID=UPI000F8E1898|nr:lysophospholipid acyltransferase family protein [Pseudorhodobacter sp. E13]RUS60026.1 glycerol acyltransferase [Pseudorhodobacter sp. E13]